MTTKHSWMAKTQNHKENNRYEKIENAKNNEDFELGKTIKMNIRNVIHQNSKKISPNVQ